MNSELLPSPPFAMADAPNTEVPMSAPPAMSKMVVIFVFSPNPIPKDTKNKIIVDPPNIIPLWVDRSLARSLVYYLALQLRQQCMLVTIPLQQLPVFQKFSFF